MSEWSSDTSANEYTSGATYECLVMEFFLEGDEGCILPSDKLLCF